MQVEKNFSFILPSRIEFGLGKAALLPEEIANLRAKRVFIVTDPGVVKSGIVERITATLSGPHYHVFDKVSPNPRDSDISNGAKEAREFGADCCVAIGGGSAIDCAKGIAVLATHDGEIVDYEGPENVPGTPLPIIAMPTTAGTGSEVTFSSVISNLEKKTKFYFRTIKVAAKVAICDPRLTVSVPSNITASTGMDALTHSIEGLTARQAEPIASAFALHSITLIAKYLRRAVDDGNDLEARSGMLMGSLLGGLSFSHSSVAAVHALAETLGGLYDMPHGVSNAIGLPAIMERNKECCVNEYAAVANAMHIFFASPKEGASLAIHAIRKLSTDIKIPKLSDYGISPKDFKEIAERSCANSSNESNPIVFSADDYMGILGDLL